MQNSNSTVNLPNYTTSIPSSKTPETCSPDPIPPTAESLERNVIPPSPAAGKGDAHNVSSRSRDMGFCDCEI